MQSKKQLELFYQKEDPWGYKNNPDDQMRKKTILYMLEEYGQFKRALDIGCGEGFITEDLPADEIYGLDISETAMKRLPEKVKVVFEPKGKYDLIIATGILYQQYDWRQVIDWIKEHSSRIILLCSIKDWEVKEVEELGKPKLEYEFPYREFTEKLRIYDKTAT